MAYRIPLVMNGPSPLSYRALAVSFATLFLLFTVSLTSCVREEDITDEQRAHQLSGELMCPVCDGQTIDGSNAQIAIDMRLKVRELLSEGNSNAEVRDYFVVRYGEEILAAPERSGFTLLAYIVPVVIVLGGIGIALITIKNMRKAGLQKQPAGSGAPYKNQTQDDLSEFLERVDRDLGISETTDTVEQSENDQSQSHSDKETS